MVTAIILAGGVGSRVGAGRPKQFVEVLGKPVLAYTIEIFENHSDVDAIEIVCHKEWKEYLINDIIKKYNYKKDYFGPQINENGEYTGENQLADFDKVPDFLYLADLKNTNIPPKI